MRGTSHSRLAISPMTAGEWTLVEGPKLAFEFPLQVHSFVASKRLFNRGCFAVHGVFANCRLARSWLSRPRFVVFC
jgi:hypothetical protein